jgi:hypothetical protein
MRRCRPSIAVLLSASIAAWMVGLVTTRLVGAQSTSIVRPGDTKSLAIPPILPAELDIVRRARIVLGTADRWNPKDTGSCTSDAVTFSIYCGLEEAGRANGDITALNAALQEARLVVWDVVVSREYDHPLTEYNNDTSTTFGDVQRLLRWSENRIVKRLGSSEPSASGVRRDDSKANPPATPVDVAIAREARQILNSSSSWNSRDTRDCPTAARTFSFYCALVEASDRVAGDMVPRGAVMQEARFAIEAVSPGEKYAHRLMDFNNDPRVGFAGVQNALRIVEAKLQERLSAGK